ncbi:MAG: HPr family phosphocarrier protein [Deltaproteobacteria bacterium]|nr:MAG: HPr family phosphocarrier protein [Deltaproteobacteria bacterium]
MEVKKKLRVKNELGLHARSAAMIVDLAKKHNAKLYFKKGDQVIEGDSILSLLTLACPKGTELEVKAVGEDAQDLMDKLTALFERGFGELS